MKKRTINVKVFNAGSLAFTSILDKILRSGNNGANLIHVLMSAENDSVKIEFKDVEDEKRLSKTITVIRTVAKHWNNVYKTFEKIEEVVKNFQNIDYNEEKNAECGRTTEEEISC